MQPSEPDFLAVALVRKAALISAPLVQLTLLVVFVFYFPSKLYVPPKSSSTPCERVFFPEKRQKKKVNFDINACLKPNVDQQNTQYYHKTK
jgi:hypothetical protein